MVRIVAAAILIFLAMVSIAAADAKRVALVIGMSEYQHLSSLANPVPDAKAIAAELKSHGFEVSDYYNLDRADLLDALEKFKRDAEGAEVALVYYAGHGMEVEGKNVLAPTDMEVECKDKTALRSVALEQLFAAAGPAPQQIVLLDACRNNPFPQCPSRGTNQGSGFRGLSLVGEQDRTLLIANATLSGALAADGDPGAHSPFATALIKNFNESPHLYFGDLLNKTAADVRVASRGGQIPEITARGGSPKICLDATGCGEGTAGAAPEGPLTDPTTIAETRTLLKQLGFVGDTSRSGGGEDILADAIKRFQAKAGLNPDGQITPTLLAVLRATKVAGIPVLPKPGGAVPGISTGPLEHDIGSTFKDCESCPDMVAIPAGRYLMGAAKSEKGHQVAEEPQHEVTVPAPFAVSKDEITFDDWETCALEGGCGNYRPEDGGWGRGRRPVIYVSFDDAKAYVEWLRQKSGKPYRLLSEAEWEFAARGGTSTPFAQGETLAPTQANFDASRDSKKPGTYQGTTVEVGSFPPNPYGLNDMEGNVFEWVEDCWNPSHAGAPADASARGGDCQRRVAKGGAWYYEADFARVASRMNFPKGSRLNVIGFRVARPLE